MSVLSLSDKIDEFKPSAYSYSFKVKVSSTVTMSESKTMVGYGLNGGDPTVTQDNLTVYTNTNKLNIEYRSGGSLLIKLETPYTANAFNHVVLVNDTTGHKIYMNGVLKTPTYTNGSNTINNNNCD
jgi:hypothetical protein